MFQIKKPGIISAPAMSFESGSRNYSHNPLSLSSFSCFFLQLMHKVVTGRAFKRFSEISSPHASQMPYVSFSSLSMASLIFPINLLSLSRIRSSKFLSDSKDARSVGSGKFCLRSVMPLTVLLASVKSSFSHCVRCFLKYSFFFFVNMVN